MYGFRGLNLEFTLPFYESYTHCYAGKFIEKKIKYLTIDARRGAKTEST